jgi:hypothetical protein
LRRDRAAQEQGITAVLRYDPARGILTGKIDSDGAVPSTVMLRLTHATQPAKDVVLEVHPAPDGVFGAALPMLERTRWQVLAESDRRDWRLEGRWHWPVQHEVTLGVNT